MKYPITFRPTGNAKYTFLYYLVMDYSSHVNTKQILAEIFPQQSDYYNSV